MGYWMEGRVGYHMHWNQCINILFTERSQQHCRSLALKAELFFWPSPPHAPYFPQVVPERTLQPTEKNMATAAWASSSPQRSRLPPPHSDRGFNTACTHWLAGTLALPKSRNELNYSILVPLTVNWTPVPVMLQF